jgi:hypothetical protein
MNWLFIMLGLVPEFPRSIELSTLLLTSVSPWAKVQLFPYLQIPSRKKLIYIFTFFEILAFDNFEVGWVRSLLLGHRSILSLFFKFEIIWGKILIIKKNLHFRYWLLSVIPRLHEQIDICLCTCSHWKCQSVCRGQFCIFGFRRWNSS